MVAIEISVVVKRMKMRKVNRLTDDRRSERSLYLPFSLGEPLKWSVKGSFVAISTNQQLKIVSKKNFWIALITIIRFNIHVLL